MGLRNNSRDVKTFLYTYYIHHFSLFLPPSWLAPWLMLMLKLRPTVAIMDMAVDTVDTVDMDTAVDTMARKREKLFLNLKPNPKLRLPQ